MNSIVEKTTLLPVFNDEWLYYISPRFLTYRTKEKIFLKTEKYTLKTAESLSELISLFKLRKDIFLSESGLEDLLDVDKFDSECDHIIILDNKTQEICGTYRIITKNNHVGFYSSQEFNLERFLSLNGIKMELGRACIHPYHRNGAVIDLLWKGIGEYANKIHADYLFGCSSSPVYSSSKLDEINHWLSRKNFLNLELEIKPLDKYRRSSRGKKSCLFNTSDDNAKSLLPPLLLSYLNAGAKVYGEPAHDREFGCLDFFTILKIDQMNTSYARRYFKK